MKKCFFWSVFFFLWAGINVTAKAQACSFTWLDAGSRSGCAGYYTLSATSMFNPATSSVTDHRWYSSNGTGLSTSREFSPTQGVYVSELSMSFSTSQTFYVAAVCNGVESQNRKTVTVSISSGSAITMQFISTTTGQPVQPYDPLCADTGVKLKANGGTNYWWTTPYGSRTTNEIIANVTGTYLLSGYNSCGETRSQSIYLTFIPALGTPSLDPAVIELCHTYFNDRKFSFSASNAESYTMEITGAGNSITSDGRFTLHPDFVGTATVTAKAYGCGDAIKTKTGYVVVRPLPSNTLTPSGTLEIPDESQCITLTAGAGDGYRYTWYKNQQRITSTDLPYLDVCEPGVYQAVITSTHHCSASTEKTTLSMPNNYNYIRTNTLLTDKKADGSAVREEDISTLSFTERQQSIEYIDGIGRPMQLVKTQASPSFTDEVQPVVYDRFSREDKKYMPVTHGNNGHYKETIISDKYGANGFYGNNSDKIADDLFPFAEVELEPSPLNRVVKQGAPGAVWRTYQYKSTEIRSIKKQYTFNKAGEVLLITYNPQTETLDPVDATYPPGRLFKNVTLDEHNNETIEYTDNEGKILCRKVLYTSSGEKDYATTYYVYDDLGNLVFVIPPEGVRAFPVVYLNKEKSATFNRNDCAGSNVGSAVVYTVPARLYSSLISQEAADQLAQDDIDANGQNNANAKGTCPLFWNVSLSGTFNRNNCIPGAFGTAVTYTVPASKYSSYFGQAQANQLAQDEINANGQAYANANGQCLLFYNVALSGTFARNNCDPCSQVGTSVTYSVPANRYTSIVSQADANQKAQNEINANGQAYANTNGYCYEKCVGEGMFLINCDECVQGSKIYIDSQYEPDYNRYRCRYVYQLPGGGYSQEYVEYSSERCYLG